MKRVWIVIILNMGIIWGIDLRQVVTEIRNVKDEKFTKKEVLLGINSVNLENSPFWTSQSFAGSIWGTHLVDITGDGYPEVITIYEEYGSGGGYCYLYLNNNGVIGSTPSWQSSDLDRHVMADFGDYDNDGDLDMAVASYGVLGGVTKIYRNDNGNLTNSPVWSGGSGTMCAWGDYDNDGDLDLAMVDMFYYPRVFKNNNGNFILSWAGSDYNLDFACTWADIDNDGDLDLLVGNINWQIPTLRIYYNTNGVLENVASWKSACKGESLAASGIFACDFDKDGFLDVAVSCGFSDNNKNIIFKNHNGVLDTIPFWFSTDLSPSGSCIFGDLNNDGFLDFAVNNGNEGAVYENIGGFISPNYSWQSNEPGGLGVDLGDIERDGIMIKQDTFIGNGIRKLFYLSIIPIQRILEITINGISIPISDYTYHLKSGWISFKNAPSSGSQIVVKYEYSIDLDFLLSDYDHNNAHLYRNTTVFIPEKQKTISYKIPNLFHNSTLFINKNFYLYDVTGKKLKEMNKNGIYFLKNKEGNKKFKIVKFWLW
jgi:hypothetical protein